MKKDAKTNERYQRFLNNQLNSTELQQLLNDFGTIQASELRNLIEDALDQVEEDQKDALRASRLNKISVAVMNHIRQADSVEKPAGKTSLFKLKPTGYFKIAASIVVIVAIGIFAKWFFAANQEIKPGGNFATLINNRGEEFDLHETIPLPAECCVTISKTNDGRIIYQSINGLAQGSNTVNTIVTPLGGKYQITLSDGSLVMLNSGSSLEFPVGFNGTERRVKLTGEAYFEITKDPGKPFIVDAGANAVKVLGTKFNISNYADDEIWSTTLLEGKIAFENQRIKKTQILKPGEQLSVDQGKIKLENVDAKEVMGWKDGQFIFKNENLKTVMHKLSRWYNVEVDYESLPDNHLYAKVSMNASLSEVLRMISLTSNLKFKIDGRRIILIE